MTELFDIPVSESPRLIWQRRVVAEWRIFTNHAPSDNWMAFSQVKAIELLEGYDLTPAQKENPMELFSHYCRLLAEAGHIADRQLTEFDAILAVCRFHGVRLWNEDFKRAERDQP